MEAKGYCMRTVHGSQVTGSEKSMACMEAEKCSPYFVESLSVCHASVSVMVIDAKQSRICCSEDFDS